jgi:hypothetical protein
MLRRAACLVGLSLFVFVAIVSADPILITNQATFTSQTGSTLVPLPVFTGTTLNAGALSFQLGAGATNFHSGDPQYGTPISGNNLLISGVESFIVLSSPVYAFGFNLYEPTSSALSGGCNTICVNSTFVITLYAGSTAIGSFTIQPPDNQVAFYGFWSSTAFDRITITETVGTDDNEFFGNFQIGQRPLNVVPEPTTMFLVGTGIVAAAIRRRMMK